MLTAKQPSNSKDTGGERNSSTPFFSGHTIQAKLQVNEPGDSHEREADAMADHVMRMSSPTQGNSSFFKPVLSGVQRKCQQCEEEDKFVHRKENSNAQADSTNGLDGYVSSLSSSGTALSESNRMFFEPRFGHDFSGVRVHTDQAAAQSAQSINALAYTTGSNIVFNSGQYSPDSDSGKRLIAHELTHVVQQNNKDANIQPQVQRDEAPGLGQYLEPAKMMLELAEHNIKIKAESLKGVFLNEEAKKLKTEAKPQERNYIFEFVLPSWLFKSELIYLKLRMSYETTDKGIGNISFSIIDADSGTGWDGDFEVQLQELETPFKFGPLLGSKIRLTFNYEAKGLGRSESRSFVYEANSFGGVYITHGNSGGYMLQYNYPEGSKEERKREYDRNPFDVINNPKPGDADLFNGK